MEIAYFVTDKDTVYTNGLKLDQALYNSEDSLLIDFVRKTRFIDWILTNHMMGRIVVSLTIDKNGKIADVIPIRSIHNEFEKGFIKELYGLPLASPARLEERNVSSLKTISVIFANNSVYVSITHSENRRLQRKAQPLEKPVAQKNDEEMPEFPGGPIEMLKYIQKKIYYPHSAKEAGLEGKCYLRFVVTKKGEISNVDVVQGVPGCIECDVEAIKVIYSMPKWKPATQKGKPVPVFFNLPINFKLL